MIDDDRFCYEHLDPVRNFALNVEIPLLGHSRALNRMGVGQRVWIWTSSSDNHGGSINVAKLSCLY